MQRLEHLHGRRALTHAIATAPGLAVFLPALQQAPPEGVCAATEAEVHGLRSDVG